MKPKKIFIVDDDKIFHFIVRKLIARQDPDTELVFFENGLEAIERLRTKIDSPELFPDVILLDINMPVLDGWQFLDEFRTLKLRLGTVPRVYVVSSSDNEMDRDRARQYREEVCDYYLKPMGHTEIEKIFLN